MKRRLLNGLAVLSLILCLTTLGFWAADGDFGLTRTWVDGARQRLHVINIYLGDQLVWSRDQINEPGESTTKPVRYSTYLDLQKMVPISDTSVILEKQERITFPGFEFRSGGPPVWTYQTVAIPSWFLALAFAILPSLRGWQLLRARKRRQENLCPTCGYDLRATPDRCPECGRATASAIGLRGE